MIIADVIHKEPTVGDGFLIECGDTLIESVITEMTEDGVVIQLDETAVQMLAENSSMWGSLFGYFDKKAGNDALKSAGYIVGVYHASDKSWDRISSVLGKDRMKTLAGALNLVKQTPGWDSNPHFREGAIEGINAVKSNDPSLEGMIRSKFNRIAASMDYLGEGWRSKLGALGAAGVLGAGAALSPSAYVNGVQYYYSDAPPSAEAQTKVVVDDRGRKIVVWTVRKPTGKENYYYDPNARKQTNEAEYRGRKVPLGKPMKGDVKKSKVYVKKPDGTVVKVNFGDKKMRIKKNNPARRKSFRARHNCANPGPRWKARYWSCRAW